MPLNVTRVFIQSALKGLEYASLTEEQEDKLLDRLVELCKIYAPDTFKERDEDDEDQ